LFLELMVRTPCCKDKSIDSTEASFTQQSKNGRTCHDRSERERATQTEASCPSVVRCRLSAGAADRRTRWIPAPRDAWMDFGGARCGEHAGAGRLCDRVAKVKPAVIAVRVKIDEPQSAFQDEEDQPGENGKGNIPMEPGSPMERFFQQYGFGQPHRFRRHHQIAGEGSGFFISADGYAVTNDHVVDHAKSVQVTPDDGTLYTAKLIGADQRTDLALIKVDGKNDFPFVKFADQTPRVGDWVVAVGNPFGLGGTVTAGIVSARGRDIGAGSYDDYMQIDAPINKGNSGGPAFDVNGDVVR